MSNLRLPRCNPVAMSKASTSLWGAALVAAIGSAAACGPHSSHVVVSQPPQREGAGFASVSLRYTDKDPMLSSDGLRLAFVSGRASADTTFVLKAFKATLPDGGDGDLPPVGRVTHTDLGFEQGATISPSGDWVVVAVAHDKGTQLYLQDFAGAKEAVAITDAATDAAAEPSVAFSPDSKLLAYRVTTAKNDAIKVVAIGGGSEAELKAGVNATTDDQRAAQATFLSMDGANYRLAVGSYSGTSLRVVDFKIKSFAAAADAATSAATDWLAARPLAIGARLVAAADRALLLETPADPKMPSLRGGNYVPPDGELVPNAHRKTLPSIYKIGESTAQPFPAEIGFEQVSPALSSDGLTSFYVTRQLYRCLADPSDFYGPSLVNVDARNKPTFVSPRLTVADPLTFEAAMGLCDRTRAGLPFSRLDDRLMQASVNAAATTTKYRAAYVSQFSTHFDGDCALKGADTEIYLLSVDGDHETIRSVSKDQAVLTDDDRGNDGPCTL